MDVSSLCCNASGSSDGDIGRLEQELQEVKELLHRLEASLGNGEYCRQRFPRDCYAIQQRGVTESGVYTIHPDGIAPFEVYCDMMTEGGGWTVFQRRQDGTVNFYRDWFKYKIGFGTSDAEFWMGNEKLYSLTNQDSQELRIDMVDVGGAELYLAYNAFRISDESDYYRLLILDIFTGNTGYDYMAFHRGLRFTTYDNDQDRSNLNCAERARGAWWYNSCNAANLNGDYSQSATDQGIILYNRGTGQDDHRLSYTEMKIRPVM